MGYRKKSITNLQVLDICGFATTHGNACNGVDLVDFYDSEIDLRIFGKHLKDSGFIWWFWAFFAVLFTDLESGQVLEFAYSRRADILSIQITDSLNIYSFAI